MDAPEDTEEMVWMRKEMPLRIKKRGKKKRRQCP
jgi:hypothetical protein